MTSFLEKAMQTAARAKAQVDELRGMRATATDTAAGGAHALAAHERGVVEHAIARGAPDPFDLLSREQAASVLGTPVRPPSLSYSDDATGVQYRAEGQDGASLSASVYHGSDAGDGDGPGYWREIVLDAYADAEPVAGVGEQALWSDPHLFVLHRGVVFYVDVTTPAGSDDARARALAAAAIVAERIEAR